MQRNRRACWVRRCATWWSASASCWSWCALATLGYWLAGWPLGDAFYMVIVTVYTVGYGEVHPVDTPLLRGITIGTIVLGCTGMIFLTGALVQFITLNQLNQIFGLRRMNTQIDKLDRHVIVCGFGRHRHGLGAGVARRRHQLRHARAGRSRRRASHATSGYLCCRATRPTRTCCATPA